MPRKPTFTITIQINNGSSPAETFTICESKAMKIIDLIQPEIKKKRIKLQSSSIKLDQFFMEQN